MVGVWQEVVVVVGGGRWSVVVDKRGIERRCRRATGLGLEYRREALPLEAFATPPVVGVALPLAATTPGVLGWRSSSSSYV